MPEEKLQTLEQRRASRAWAHVQSVPKQGKLPENYRSLVHKAPAMIKMNGLGQTLAFLLAQEKKSAEDIQKVVEYNQLGADGLLYKHLEEWLVKEAPIPWTSSSQGKDTLIERILAEDSVVYQLVSEEAMAYLGWLKRFAQALFGGESPEG